MTTTNQSGCMRRNGVKRRRTVEYVILACLVSAAVLVNGIGCRPEEQQDQPRTPEDWSITIEVNKDGKVVPVGNGELIDPEVLSYDLDKEARIASMWDVKPEDVPVVISYESGCPQDAIDKVKQACERSRYTSITLVEAP